MGIGLEEKRISYVISNKRMDPSKVKQLSELTAANEKYGEVLRKVMSKMKEEMNLIASAEIDMRNAKEAKVADMLLDARTKLVKAEAHLRSAVNTLI